MIDPGQTAFTYTTYSAFCAKVRRIAVPAGVGETQKPLFDTLVVNALIRAQKYVDCLRKIQVTVIDKDQMFENCGVANFVPPRGKINLIYAFKPDEACLKHIYHPSTLAQIHCWSQENNCGWETVPPGVGTEVYARGSDICYDFSQLYPGQEETDDCWKCAPKWMARGRNGEVYLAPRLPCGYLIAVHWEGLKRTWSALDPVPDDEDLADWVAQHIQSEMTLRSDRDIPLSRELKSNAAEKFGDIMYWCNEERRLQIDIDCAQGIDTGNLIDMFFGVYPYNAIAPEEPVAPEPEPEPPDPVAVTSDAPATDQTCVGAAYLRIISIVTGTGPFTWSETSLPSWLTFVPIGNGSTGVLSGVAINPGNSSVMLQVTSSEGMTLDIEIAIAVIQITTTSLGAAMVGIVYSDQLNASGGDGNYVWAITSGALPTGLSLDPDTGVISGTPSGDTGVYSITVSVEGACEKELTITLIALSPPEEGIILRLESSDFDASADDAPVTAWTNTGTENFNFASPSSPTLDPSVDQSILCNGHATVRFESLRRLSDNSDGNAIMSALTAAEIFVIFRRDEDPAPDNPNGGAPFQFCNTTNPPYFASAVPFTDGVPYENFPCNARVALVNPTLSFATAFRCYNLRNSQATNQLVAFLDDEPLYNGPATFATQFGILYIGVGVWQPSFYSLKGNIAAIYMYDRILGASERTQLAAFILSKWGVVASES